MMQPSDPFREVTNEACTDCGGELAGNRWRCPACIQAARLAVERSGGAVVRPSDVARAREDVGR